MNSLSQIDKLIVKRELLAMKVKHTETREKNTQKADKLRRKLWLLDSKLDYTARKNFRRVCWESECYYTRSGIEVSLDHPADIVKVF